jgi:guanylate kinase
MNRAMEHIDGLQQLPTATTRPMRTNEAEGREHHFVNRTEFERMIADHELLEWQNVHGSLYGVPRGTVEHLITQRLDRIADIDILGALLVRSLYPDNVVLVFVKPGADDDIETTVRERLAQRGDTEADIENRLRRVEMEMSLAHHCDYLLINENLTSAGCVLNGIIHAERSRRNLANLKVKRSLPRHPLAHTVAVLAIHDEKLLHHNNALPLTRLLTDELPQEAAARVLAPVHNVLSEPGFRVALAITAHQHAHFEELRHWYPFTLPPLAALPEGWAWRSLAETDLPGVIRNELGALTYPSVENQ